MFALAIAPHIIIAKTIITKMIRKLCRKIYNKFYAWIYPELYRDMCGRLYKLEVERKWRERNLHNRTRVNYPIGEPVNDEVIQVGNFTYGTLNVYSWGTPDEKLIIGNCCSIASGTKFILGGMHNMDTITTYPIKRAILQQETEETFSKGPIVIEDDVWIGTDVTILSGVTIGRGAVIAAGSIVTRSVLAYSLWGGGTCTLCKTALCA